MFDKFRQKLEVGDYVWLESPPNKYYSLRKVRGFCPDNIIAKLEPTLSNAMIYATSEQLRKEIKYSPMFAQDVKIEDLFWWENNLYRKASDGKVGVVCISAENNYKFLLNDTIVNDPKINKHMNTLSYFDAFLDPKISASKNHGLVKPEETKQNKKLDANGQELYVGGFVEEVIAIKPVVEEVKKYLDVEGNELKIGDYVVPASRLTLENKSWIAIVSPKEWGKCSNVHVIWFNTKNNTSGAIQSLHPKELRKQFFPTAKIHTHFKDIDNGTFFWSMGILYKKIADNKALHLTAVYESNFLPNDNVWLDYKKEETSSNWKLLATSAIGSAIVATAISLLAQYALGN